MPVSHPSPKAERTERPWVASSSGTRPIQASGVTSRLGNDADSIRPLATA